MLVFLIISILIYAATKRMKTKDNIKTQEIASYHNEMTEYTRETRLKLGFGLLDKGFKRPMDLKRKGLTDEESRQLEKAKLMDKKFSKAIQETIPLKALYTENIISNKSIRVFVDSQIDTTLIVMDHTAVYGLRLDKFYDVAGEFIIINFSKKGDKVVVNYILPDH